LQEIRTKTGNENYGKATREYKRLPMHSEVDEDT
jgi:hypothetical protein